jgi:precorrin-2/cobalt-factor-2 C20-methyltransferase
MKGKLIGVGVGPGDPQLLTLKAVRLIEKSPIIAVPGKKKEDTVAYQIVKQVVEGLEKKECLTIYMPMTKDKDLLAKSHQEGAKQVAQALDQGNDVAFLTLGDPTIYATYLYIHQLVKAMGYQTEIVSGVPSFCAVAAKLDIGLVEKAEMLHLIPSSYHIEAALKLPGTKILMKTGSKMAAVKAQLKEMEVAAVMVENCGMDQEKVYLSTDEIPKDAGYYSILIVKDKKEI